jgi:hypothetical protein
VDSVRLNVNAAIFSQTDKMGAGVAIRNYLGEVLLAKATPFEFVSEPEVAGAKAARWALLTAHQTGRSRVLLASDCLNLLKKINCARQDRYSVGALVHDSKASAASFIHLGADSSSTECCMIISQMCQMVTTSVVMSADYAIGRPLFLGELVEHTIGDVWVNVVPEIIRTIFYTEQPLFLNIIRFWEFKLNIIYKKWSE